MLYLAIFFVLLCIKVSAQVSDTSDTSLNILDSTSSSLTENKMDSLSKDSLSSMDKEKRLGIKISKDALPAIVKTSAKDSAILNMQTNKFYLHGDANAEYQDITVKSGDMVYDQATNEIIATPQFDTSEKKTSVQQFNQGQEMFTYDTLRYNFRSKRAIVRNARSQYGEGYVWSTQVKRNEDESIYGWKNLYTTCNLDHPHFGIRANKIKVIPGKMIASGFAKLEIQDIPTPFILPFGIFPTQKGQKSGFILPTYTLEENRGLGLQRGGYYFAIADYVGLITQFDIFSKGSWGIFNTAQYAKRYKYNGSFSINYSYNKLGEIYEPDGRINKDFKITWNHQMDGKARPGTNFSANVDIGSNTYNEINGMSVDMRLTNNFASSISYSKSWAGKPYSFNASLRHNQNTQTRQVTLTLPELNFNLGQFSPFQRKFVSGNPRWYEKITFNYSTSLVNWWNFKDSAFNINNIDFLDFDNGIRHNANVQANYNVLKFFTLNFNVPYREYWNTKKVQYIDDPSNNTVDTIIATGFFPTRDFDIQANLSTRIYGIKMFKKGKVMGLRHVLTPNIGASYKPSFAHTPFNYMYPVNNYYGETIYRSYFSNSPISGPSNYINTGAINFSLNNTLSMKVRQRDTSMNKNISLIDGFLIGTSYNMFADSNNLSDIRMSFRTSLLGRLNIAAAATFDPYRYDNGRRTSAYLFQTGGGVADFKNGNVSLGISFDGRSQKNREGDDFDTGDEEKNEEVGRLLRNGGLDDYYDFNIPWNLNISSGINIVRRRVPNRSDSIVLQPNLSFNGGFNLTERWQVNVSSGLDFVDLKNIRMGLTDIGITRDLHCWQMSLNYVPFGPYRSFFFTLNVKAAVLQDLKLTRRRAFQDNY